MTDRKWITAACGLAATTVLIGCGGSGGSSTGGTTAGIDGTGSPSPIAVVSAGTVTGFGSVIVNGVRFETASASFTIDGQPGTQSELAVGDFVIVKGELDDNDSSQGTAQSITFDDVVEGPIAAVDSLTSTLTVLGQTVHVTPDTSFDDSIQPQSLAGFAVNDVVEISGLVASDGSVTATRIEPKLNAVEFELTGLVVNHNGVDMTFNINSQIIDYSSAMLMDFDNGMIDDGDLVEVRASTVLGGNGELLVTRVEFKGEAISGDNGDLAELEGFITRFNGITDFDVAGFPVTTSGNPLIEGGIVADLGLDIKVEVEGSLEGGVLVATKIDIRRSNAVRAIALVDSVNAANSSFVMLGITIKVDTQTRLEDKSTLDVETFSIADLTVSDYVEVRGIEFPADSGEILAGRLEREDVDNNTELQGFVEVGSVADPSFSILGVSVATNGSTVFRDINDVVIDSATFFATAEGQLVKVDGTEITDTAISANQVEFENQ